MNDRELLEQALEALEIEQGAHAYLQLGKAEHIEEAITALRERLAQPEFDSALQSAAMTQTAPKLAQPEQEPVAWKTDDVELYVREDKFGFYNIPLYTTPPRCPNCASLEAQNTELDAKLAEMEKGKPVAWRDHVEQRLLTWRQSFVSRSGDQLALDDFMDKESLDDLIDYVCDEYTTPPRREWVGLTEEELEVLEIKHAPPVHPDVKDDDWWEFARAIAAKLREKNA